MRVTVGILGAGSLIGQGLIKALRMSDLSVRIVAMDAFRHAVGLYWADAGHILPDVLAPGASEMDYVARIISVLRSSRVDVLLVATDFDVPRLARHRQWIERDSGCRVVVSSPEVADIADDKWMTVQFLQKYGLPAPQSTIDFDLDSFVKFIDRVGFPLIIKPRCGARARGVSIVRTQEDLPHALTLAGPRPIVQQYVGSEEDEYTAGAVVLDDECVGAIVMRRDLRDGNTYRAYLSPFHRLEDLVRQTAMALKPTGPVNFQLRIGDNGPVIFEINARFSGTTVIRALAGFNEAEAVVVWALSGRKAPLRQQRFGVVLRYWEEIFLSWDDYRAVGGPED